MKAIRWSEEALAAHEKRLGKIRAAPDKPTAPQSKQGTDIKRGQSAIEVMLAQQVAIDRLPIPRRNYRPLAHRKFEIDFAWPGDKIGVEVQGMVHRIKERFEADIEKRALLLLDGWSILEVSGASIRDGRAIAWLKQLMKERT